MFFRTKTPRVSNNVVGSGDMSLNDEQVLASSESFWEVGKFMRAVTRIDNGHALCSSLRQLINQRAEIEKGYAKQLAGWTKKWDDILDKGKLLSHAGCKAADENFTCNPYYTPIKISR